MSYLLSIAFCLAACFTTQALALRLSGGRFMKGESNFFSSIGRIQAGADGDATAMLLGSSITGRLPDRAQGFVGWANMGCDGGSAVDVLRAIDSGILPIAPLLVIEANTLQLALEGKRTEISRAMQGAWFRLGVRIPALSAYARPSAFFYSKLLERRTGSFELPEGEDLGAHGRPSLVVPPSDLVLTEQEQALIEELIGILSRLQKRGTEAVIVWLPPVRTDGSSPPAWIVELAYRCNVPYWDLSQQAAPGAVVLTDGVHMSAPSATRTMRSLQSALSAQP